MARTAKTGEALAPRAKRILIGLLVGWTCPVCGGRINMSACKRTQLQIDHLHAAANGGTDAPGNLIPMCGACNATKNSHDTIEGLALALVKNTRIKTVEGAKRRIDRTNMLRDLEWLAVAVGAILEAE